jgi:hypothetical protein
VYPLLPISYRDVIEYSAGNGSAGSTRCGFRAVSGRGEDEKIKRSDGINAHRYIPKYNLI